MPTVVRQRQRWRTNCKRHPGILLMKKKHVICILLYFWEISYFFQILSRDWWDIVSNYFWFNFFYKQYVDIGRIWNLKSRFLISFYKFIFDEQYFDIGRIWNFTSRYEIVINQTYLFFPVLFMWRKFIFWSDAFYFI